MGIDDDHPQQTDSPETQRKFRTYAGYFCDWENLLEQTFGGLDDSAPKIYAAVGSQPAVAKIQRRKLDAKALTALGASMKTSWGMAGRLRRELEEPEFDREANAWLPEQAYYAIYHAIRAFALASGQAVPTDHRTALRLIEKEVARGTVPNLWSPSCTGCPQLKTAKVSNLKAAPSVSPLSRPTGVDAEVRLAMFLRTTRERELDRLYQEQRKSSVQRPRCRRNLSRDEKLQIAARLSPTTVFNLFWRVRKKAHYEDPDMFVDGAVTSREAEKFGVALVHVTEATLFVIEALIAAYVGPEPMINLSNAYSATRANKAVAKRALFWAPGVRIAKRAQRLDKDR